MNELYLGMGIGMVIMWGIKDSIDEWIIARAKRRQNLNKQGVKE